MNTRRMTPTELRILLRHRQINFMSHQIERMAGVAENGLDKYLCSNDEDVPAPISRTLCTQLLALGLAVDLARPWVPDELAEVLAPTSRA